MGADEHGCCTGPRGAGHGADSVENVSVFPRHIAGKTNATALMRVEEAASLVAGALKHATSAGADLGGSLKEIPRAPNPGDGHIDDDQFNR
jgi:hypothetical protein